MKTMLRKVVSSNILLYYLWYLFVRKRKGLPVGFFRRETDIYIDGYERSGNTFIIHLMRQLLPELNTVDHLHAIAPIKIAFMLDLSVFILIRNPLDCISSKYLKHFAMRELEVDTKIDVQLLDQFILDYLNYYQFVKKNQDKLTILDFEQLIESPEKTIAIIQDRLETGKKFTCEDFLQAVYLYKGATDTMGSSLPNPEKEKYKSLVKEEIISSDKYPCILDLYNSIINHT